MGLKVRCSECGRVIEANRIEEHYARYHPELLGDTTRRQSRGSRAGSSFSAARSRSGGGATRRKVTVIVDGNNVLYHGSKYPRLENLQKLYQYLRKLGHHPLIVVSRAIKYRIDDPVGFQSLLQQGIIMEARENENDDLLVLDLAVHYGVPVISNDHFIDHQQEYQKVSITRVPFSLNMYGQIKLKWKT